MSSPPEICTACVLTIELLQAGGGESTCSALGSSPDFNRFRDVCAAVKILASMGIHVTSLEELLKHFPDLGP